MNNYLRWIAGLSGFGALWSALTRSTRKGGLGRAAWSAMLGGAAVAAFFLEFMPRGVMGVGELLWLLLWCALTHLTMAVTESILAWLVVGRSRLYPGKALRGALWASIMGHVGGFLAFAVIFLSGIVWMPQDDLAWIGFLVLFLPFALAGGALASLGTVYGDVSRPAPRRAAGEHIPG